MAKHKFTPFSFTKTYNYKRKLEKLASPHKLRYFYGNSLPYCNLKTNTINLPFVEPLDLEDLKTALEHEKKHFEITKEPAIIFDPSKYSEITLAANILEDIIINESISSTKLKRLIKKLGLSEKDQITLWYHLTEEQRKKIIEKMIKSKIIKDEYSVEEVYEIFEKTIEERKHYDSLRHFSETITFKRFVEIFNKTVLEPGDGPSEFTSRYYLPDWNLVKIFTKILKNFNVQTENIIVKKQFYGKRINRSFLENITEIYPFKYTYSIIKTDQPKVTVILDCSGSMKKDPERLAKSFIVALMNVNRNTTAVLHNEYFTIVTESQQTVIKTPMTGDERFDTLIDRLPNDFEINKTDILIVITDLNINESEAEGLYELGEIVKTTKKYILCVNDRYYDEYPELDDYYKRVSISTKEKFIEFCKKLVSKYS